MLELKNIHKDYPAGSGVVHALRGVDLQFRESEFVSILGPSGCGKTTLLNIIGGLDQYTTGDLVIRGRSTKDFKDRDWDAYRNHSVGFVFQSYNLIPHQTVLQNVEIALTLSGVGKAERRRRAIKVLEDVGLGDQLKKRPAQMSGGQMQRVAIARALVNNPDIILADEPTGALDSETSVQIMELLKEIARERLVVMVTHNPEIAETYSTRIIRMLDGKLLSDSAPLDPQEVQFCRKKNQEQAEASRTAGKKEKKPSMGMRTAFGLSLKNLVAKRGRTTLTSFAGSIGIIGIALIYAVSQGVTAWINSVQEDTLSSYPLTIEAKTMDLSGLMASFLKTAESNVEHDRDKVYTKSMVYDLVNTLNDESNNIENDLKAFKVYLEEASKDPEDPLYDAINGLQYSYDLNMAVYTKNVGGEIVASDAEALLMELIQEHLGMDTSILKETTTSGGGMMSMMGMSSEAYKVWQELLPGEDGSYVNPLLDKQYDVIYGDWPKAYNEVVLVVDENNEMDDMALYALGLKTAEEMDRLTKAALTGDKLEIANNGWSYEEICGREYRVVLPSSCYALDKTTNTYTDLRQTEAGMQILYDNGVVLKVSGIISPSEEATAGMLTGAVGYTAELTRYIISQADNSPAVIAQKENPDIDVLTGLPFRSDEGDMTDADKAAAFRTHIQGLDEKGKAEAYVAIMSVPNEETLTGMVQQAMAGATPELVRQQMAQAYAEQTGMSVDEITAYMEGMSDEELMTRYEEEVVKQVKAQYAAQVEAQMSAMTDAELAGALAMAMETYTEEQCAQYYEAVLKFSDSDYEQNLQTLGCLDLSDPSRINIYASSFENKDVIEAAINRYNEGVDETKQISYTDYVGLIMSSMTTIINAITYVLIAFVAISLVVSSIMIGVITLISVQERTKEIGILRAIGASKRNVSNMFNAETVMIGAASGLIGVGMTYLLCWPINAIIHALTDIPTLSARLPIVTALILIGISIFLSVLAGFIPSRSAAKKDPVIALRTE